MIHFFHYLLVLAMIAYQKFSLDTCEIFSQALKVFKIPRYKQFRYAWLA